MWAASSSPFCAARAASECSVAPSVSRSGNGEAVELQLAGFDLREVENVVEQRQQRVGRALHQPQVLALLVR